MFNICLSCLIFVSFLYVFIWIFHLSYVEIEDKQNPRWWGKPTEIHKNNTEHKGQLK
jgi:hypothetical protein